MWSYCLYHNLCSFVCLLFLFKLPIKWGLGPRHKVNLKNQIFSSSFIFKTLWRLREFCLACPKWEIAKLPIKNSLLYSNYMHESCHVQLLSNSHPKERLCALYIPACEGGGTPTHSTAWENTSLRSQLPNKAGKWLQHELLAAPQVQVCYHSSENFRWGQCASSCAKK